MKSSLRKARLRKETGAAFAALVTVASVLVVGSLGLFGAEVTRTNMARQQLSAACESAALAASAAMASTDPNENGRPMTDLAYTKKVHDNAKLAAHAAFNNNSILGVALHETTSVGANEGAITVEFINPETGEVVAEINPAGTKVRVSGQFGLVPMTGTFLPIGQSNITAMSFATVPKLDIAFVFDQSASMDDQTPVTLVKRFWKVDDAADPENKGHVEYLQVASDTIDKLIPSDTGQRMVNALPPQSLDLTGSYKFDGGLRGTNTDPANTGDHSKPGNYPKDTITNDSPTKFTELVVNIVGQSYGSFAFNNLATVVEAARGNLENSQYFSGSGANTSPDLKTVTPQTGWQSAYTYLASQMVSPMRESREASINFFKTFNASSNVHYSWTGYADTAGTEDPGYTTQFYVSSKYTLGGDGPFSFAQIPLNSQDPKFYSNYKDIKKILAGVQTDADGNKLALRALGTANIADALDKAIIHFTTARTGAKKAIVLFASAVPTTPVATTTVPTVTVTPGHYEHDDLSSWEDSSEDGYDYYGYYHYGHNYVPAEVTVNTDEPTESNSDAALQAALAAAQRAADQHIPIYLVGLMQDRDNADLQQIADVTKAYGGTFYQVTDVKNLNKTMENIARQLVSLSI